MNVNNFQLNIKNWSGPDLSERSFRLVHSGNLQRKNCEKIQPIGVNLTVQTAEPGEENEESENSDRDVALFNNEIVICSTVS